MDAVKLAELLCARLCHDLAGPVGAASAGAELFEDLDGAGDAETLGLVASSAASAAARLKYFRAALGPAASNAQPAATVRELIQAYLGTQVSAASPGYLLEWKTHQPSLEGEATRLLLNLILLAKDALPRGGRIEVTVEDGLPQVLAHGEPAGVNDEARAVLMQGKPATGPRGAQAHFARAAAVNIGARLSIQFTPQGLALTLRRDSSVVDA